jgi:membrane-bound lytic murein transglycosylase D
MDPRKLPPPQLQLTPEVERQLQRYSWRQGSSIEAAVEKNREHLEAMTGIFEDEGVPVELLNVAIIESGLEPRARSGAGAAGMWQFMKSTARIYGLAINLVQDQRMDPVLSTVAAAKHLRDLYLSYKDWYLALAAYNAGPGSVNRAINRSGSRDFWILARGGHLRQETCEFVPRFIAASLIRSNLGSAAGVEFNQASNG